MFYNHMASMANCRLNKPIDNIEIPERNPPNLETAINITIFIHQQNLQFINHFATL